MAPTMDRPSPAPPWVRERRRIGPVEALEDVLGLLGVHARAVVGHGDHRAVFVVVDADPCGRPRRGVGPDVAEQVVDDLTEAGGVAHHLDGLGRPRR